MGIFSWKGEDIIGLQKWQQRHTGVQKQHFENRSSRKYKALFHPVLGEHDNLGAPVSLFRNDNETPFCKKT